MSAHSVRFTRLDGVGAETIDLDQCLRLVVGVRPNPDAPWFVDPSTVVVYYLTSDHEPRGIMGLGGLAHAQSGSGEYAEVHPIRIARDMEMLGLKLPPELKRYRPFLHLSLPEAIVAWENSRSCDARSTEHFIPVSDGSAEMAGDKSLTPSKSGHQSTGSVSVASKTSSAIAFLRLDGGVAVMDPSTADYHDGPHVSRRGTVSVASLIRVGTQWLKGWKHHHSGMGAREPQLRTDPMPTELTPADAAKFCACEGIRLPAKLVLKQAT